MATTLGAMAVGSIVKLNVGGAPREFIVVQHGKPSAMYDDSFNGGTWLLMRDVYEKRQWHSADVNDYANSTIHAYLNSSFLGVLDSNFQETVKQVNIPYCPGSRGDMGVSSGANGLPCTVFFLSCYEVGWTSADSRYFPPDGAKLAYFAADGITANNNKRIAYLGGEATPWWLRSPFIGSPTYAESVEERGDYANRNCSKSYGIRPTLVLPSNSSLVLSDGSIVLNQPPSTPTSVTVPATVKGGAPLAISWGGSSDPDGNLSGYRLERSVNNGGYGQIYQGGATSYTDQITYGWGSVAYRVKAYDALGVESGYITSATRAVVNNSAPSAPASISVPATVRGGKACAVSWGAATDVDGNLTGYKLERSVNGGGYAQIYAGTARSFTDTITRGWVSVIYRVRAYDAENAHSGYTTAPSRTIVNNLAPVISGADGDLGLKSGAFSQTYSVTDDDGDPITVTEKLDAATLRTYTATAGATNTLTIDADRFMRTLNGRRTVSATAKDNQGGATTRTWTFTKSVTSLSVALKTPLPADAAVTKCVLNVVREIPLGADFTVEVCNNAFDVSPTWEDATAAVLSGRKYFLANTTKTAANWGFNLRIAVDRKNTVGECYIAGIGGAFA